MDNQDLIAPLLTLWNFIKEFANSNFTIALIGSGAGAWAGAAVVQKIIEKEKNKSTSLNEIRGINAAIAISISIFNSLMNTKKQFIKPVKDLYETQKIALSLHSAGVNSGQISPDIEFQFEADLRSLQVPHLPLDILQNFIYEKTLLSGGILNLFSTLNQSYLDLCESIEKRNQLIEKYKSGQPALSHQLYFGLPSASVINEDYPSLINAIHIQTENALYFSRLLCIQLTKYGNSQANEFNNLYKTRPKINYLVISDEEIKKLLPNAQDYPSWEKIYPEN